jgi:hypothetical protein
VVDRPRLDQLLTLLERYVTILRELAMIPLEDFVDDPRNYGSARTLPAAGLYADRT